MLGRYVGGTLLILGVAMLMAPEAETDHEGAQATATAAGAPGGTAEVVARAEGSPAALGARTASSGDVEIDIAGHEREVLARLDMSETDEAGAGAEAEGAAPPLAAPEEGRLVDLLAGEEPVDQAAPVPTLSQPETLLTTQISDQTRALIEQAQGRAPARQGSAGPGDDTLYVIGSWVNVRSGPSTEFGVITALPYGEAVELVADEGSGWVRIRMAEAGEGFMSTSFLAARPGG